MINEFNRELINMRGYYNDVSSVGAVRQKFGGAIDNIIGIVRAGGDDFYFDEGFLTQYLPEVRSLSSQLKDVSDLVPESAVSLLRSNVDWHIDYQTIDMSGTLYPFTGLKD